MTEITCYEKLVVVLEENVKLKESLFVLERERSMKRMKDDITSKEETAMKDRLRELECERSKTEKSEEDKRDRKKQRNLECRQKKKAKRIARIAEARNV